MDGKRKLEFAIENVNNAVAELEEARAAVEAAVAKTAEVLAISEQIGVKTVSIGKVTPLVGNEGWSFGASGSIFTPRESRHNGWPSAWHISEAAGIGGGAGNTGQHQIDSSKVIDGVYRCVNGQWERVKKYDV